jgi:hypothetical protein
VRGVTALDKNRDQPLFLLIFCVLSSIFTCMFHEEVYRAWQEAGIHETRKRTSFNHYTLIKSKVESKAIPVTGRGGL